jgi:prepilin-type N-terminal cleavage/methylation domain-containing protein
MRNRRGFTLIELLVVIAIIGILATLVITQLAGAQVRARNANAKSDITQIGKAIGIELTNNAAMGDKYYNAVDTNGTATNLTANNAGTKWTALFNSDTGYNKLHINRSPSSAQVYRYSTDQVTPNETLTAGSTYYCISTSVSTASNVSDTGFYVNNGASGNSAGIAPTHTAGVCN